MKSLPKFHHIALNSVLFLVLVLLLPFLLTFDTVIYWMTRPTCMSCGSLAEYVRTVSVSAAWTGGIMHNMKEIGVMSLIEKIKI